MKLVIVEAPSKSKTIQKYLGAGYKVVASGGHVRDLPEKSFGIDIEKNFQPEYVVSDDKKDTIKKIKAALKGCDEVYLATDPDREGEAISWHLAQVLELENPKRIEFNEISQKAVNKALSTPRELNINLINAQQARRVLDRLVGYKISPILNRKIRSGLSGGRVQSAALKMIVDREREILAFVPEEFWNIFAFLTKESTKTPFRTSLHDCNGKKLKVTCTEEARLIEANLKEALWNVAEVKRGVSKSKPQAPFTTSTLQQDGSQRLAMSAPDVMRIAQQLYEGVEIEGEGQTALVTYIRTDSVRVSPDAQAEALSYIAEVYGSEYAPKKPNFYKTKSSNVQDAHEAIRPISLTRTPESLKNKINKNQYRLYKLVYDRFLASQMTDAVYNTLNVKIDAKAPDSNVYGFRLTGKTLIFKGYTAVYDNAAKDEDEADPNGKLPDFQEGEKLLLKELKCEQKFTKAPPRFTDATLVKAMEENGIGRPSTYASVISVLAKRIYTEKEQKNIKPTELGMTVVGFMESNFADIVDVKFTADMETKLDTVEKGTEWQKILRDFYPKFNQNINKAYTAGSSKVKAEAEVSDTKCEKCGAFMVVKTSKYGKFLACPNYPACKNIKSLAEVVGKCPRCGGNVIKRKTKTGKDFYGCSNYPNCDFRSWDLPAPQFCPKCSGIMKVVSKNGNKNYVCTIKTCGHTVVAESEKEE